jgi:hypothetical protein
MFMVARGLRATVLRGEELSREVDGGCVFGEFVSVIGLLLAGE